MGYEGEYRIALAVGFVTLFVFGGRYRLRSKTSEKLDRRQEGWFILIGLRLTAFAALIVVLTYLFAPRALAWSAMGLPALCRWLGFGIAALSGCLKIWTFHSLGKNLTDTVVTREKHSLITHGPYRYVRHPFYTSFALDVAGISCLTDSWFLLLLGAIAFGMIVVRTRREEENLLRRFGEPYREYRDSVAAFVPYRFLNSKK